MSEYKIHEIRSQFPEFEIISEVGNGEGAFKSVFKVRRLDDNQILALKILSPDSFDAARLYRETQAMKTIQSPYIPKLIKFELEVSEERSVVYILEEFIEGQTLKDYLKNHPIPPLTVSVSVMDKLLQGLEACWAKKIVHRDIKPANIMIRVNDEPIIIDFGLSRHLDMVSLTPTAYNGVLGTPMYAPPEILYYRKAEINGTTDLYSLGITFYQMLTNMHPFLTEEDIRGDYEAAIHKMLTVSPRPPHEINQTLPKKVSDFVLRLIERQPIDRFKDAKQARERLAIVTT